MRRGQHWTRERVRREILTRQKRKLPLYERAVQQTCSGLWNAARRLYGSWLRALKKVGIDPDTVRRRRRRSRREVLDALTGMIQKGVDLSYTSVRRSHPTLVAAAEARFGSWSNTLKASRVDPQSVARHRRWTDSSVLTALRALGRGYRLGEVRDMDTGLVAAALKAFGSWEGAMHAAGFEYTSKREPPKWPRSTILSAIRHRKRLRLSLQDKDVIPEVGGLYSAARREFETWRKAVEASGVPYPGRQRWPEEYVLSEIRRRRDHHLPLNPGAVNRQQPGLFDAGKRHFGSWPRAVARAGVR